MSVDTSYVAQMDEIVKCLMNLNKMVQNEVASSFQEIKEQRKKIDHLFLELATLSEIKIGDLNLGERLQQLRKSYDDLQKKVEEIAKIYLPPSINYEEKLQQWVDHAGGDKKARRAVQTEILNFWKDSKKNKLKFNDLNIEDLPDLFDHPASIERLFVFECNGCQLIELAKSIGSCTSLKSFYCSYNPLLTTIPESMGNCKALTRFNCTNNASLTTILESMGNWVCLEYFNCSDNPLLTALPESMGNCLRLKEFDSSENPSLRALPRNIGNLRRLQYFDCPNNLSLTEIPESIVNCRFLNRLDCSGCRSLHRLPDQIINLPKGCTVDLQMCGFSDAVMERLRSETNAEGYAGPTFIYSMEHHHPLDMEKSIEEYLTQVYQNAQMTSSKLPTLMANEEYKSFFKEWLKRLSYAAEGGSRQVGETKYRAFYRAIVQNLELAERDLKFRGPFWNAILQGSTTCGDRIALSVVDLGIRRKGVEVAGKGVKDTWDYLKQRLALTILDKCAKDKVSKMKFCDEIEVYLAFALEGWKRLGLPPLDVTEILFASYVTELDFNDAAEKVHSVWSNHPLICDYLLDQPEWLPALYIDYPSEMQTFKEAKLRTQEIKKEVTCKAKDLSEQEFAEDPLSQEYTKLESFTDGLLKQLTLDAILKLQSTSV